MGAVKDQVSRKRLTLHFKHVFQLFGYCEYPEVTKRNLPNCRLKRLCLLFTLSANILFTLWGNISGQYFAGRLSCSQIAPGPFLPVLLGGAPWQLSSGHALLLRAASSERIYLILKIKKEASLGKSCFQDLAQADLSSQPTLTLS